MNFEILYLSKNCSEFIRKLDNLEWLGFFYPKHFGDKFRGHEAQVFALNNNIDLGEIINSYTPKSLK